MDITLKGNNGEKVVIPIEDLIQKYWSDENSKPNRIEMSAKVKDETILAAMTICDEKEENYLSVDLESRNEKFDTEALWCSLEAPNTHGYVKYDKSMIVSKDETTVNRIADMLDSMGFDAVTGYFNPEEDKRSGEVDSLTGYYYVDI